MAPRLAAPPAASASGSSGVAPQPALASRSDPKPVLRASKEWIVPPRPKPGRKSTKPPAEPKPTAAKTSQKAFRERRQEYVTELEEKVRQLEAGEGEKCVFYQQQAQRAKAESTALAAENDQLKKSLDRLRREIEALKSRYSSPAADAQDGLDKGKARALPADFDHDAPSSTTSKRPRRSAAVRAQAVVAAASGATSPSAFGSSSSSLRHRSSSSSTSSHPSPSTSTSSTLHSPPTSSSVSTFPVFAHSPLNEVHPASPAAASPEHAQDAFAGSDPHASSCGFCATSSDCLCAEIGFKTGPASSSTLNALSAPSSYSDLAGAGPRNDDDLDDLFANETTYEPAVPLRLASSSSSNGSRRKVKSVWAIEPSTTKFEAVVAVADKVLCSGDPSNCPACSDDPFGKAFCNALSSTVCSTTPCANCPGNCGTSSSKSRSDRIPTPPPDLYARPVPSLPTVASTSSSVIDAEEAALFESLTDLPCCGNPSLCGSLTCQPASSSGQESAPVYDSSGPANAETILLPRSVEPGVRTVETVPCNEAWSVLKAHPNIAFADLQMLAEVVSKRTHCAGPVLSPVQPSSSSARFYQRSTSPNRPFDGPPSSAGPLPFSGPEPSASSKPQLVPHATLLQCSVDAGVRKRLTVERGAVNEALELLDRAAARGGALRR
ncbi:hypothetical protein JCM10212_004770 [Sporobolomyces blumeae]